MLIKLPRWTLVIQREVCSLTAGLSHRDAYSKAKAFGKRTIDSSLERRIGTDDAYRYLHIGTANRSATAILNMS